MSDTWTERLSEYIDGMLLQSERAALEEHLASCAGCRTTLDELRRVVARAGALNDRPPAADLWPGIATRIGLASGRRRFSFTVPQLVAASIALTLASGGSAWLVLRGRGGGGAPPPIARAPVPILSNAASGTDRRYDAAVADLERALERDRGRLDTTTVRVIEKNLAIIDRAIRDAQSALAADPANSYLNLHLAQEKRRKLELLRRAAALAVARS